MASSDQNPQTPGPGSSKPVDGNGQVVEAANDTSERPFLAFSEPMREDQVQNAVKFLSHPKVRGSPVIYRRSFLEKKGLTKEEIDEAFHRVPDPPSNATSDGAAAISQVVQPKPPTSLQTQAPVQSLQLAGVPVSSAMVPSMQQSRFQWSHALISAGVLAASGAGTALFFKNVVVPRLKTWIQKVVAEEKESDKEDKPHSILADQTAEAAKAAATAAAAVAKASEELLNSKSEEKKYFEAFMSMMDVQVKELKTMGEAIRKLESTKENGRSQDKMMEEYIRTNIGNGTTNNSWSTSQVNQSGTDTSSIPKHMKVNGTTNFDYAAVRPSSAPTIVEPTPHSKSYMEIMAMIQRGERPPNIRPWEVPQPKPVYSAPSQPTIEDLSSLNEENGVTSDLNGNAHDSSEPWLKTKTVKLTDMEPEAEELRQKQQLQQLPLGGSLDRPLQRSWVPPQPPSVVIPEAATAIRQPKKQQSGEIAQSEDGENSVVVASEDMITEPEASAPTIITESNQSEIEEVGVEMS